MNRKGKRLAVVLGILAFAVLIVAAWPSVASRHDTTRQYQTTGRIFSVTQLKPDDSRHTDRLDSAVASPRGVLALACTDDDEERRTIEAGLAAAWHEPRLQREMAAERGPQAADTPIELAHTYEGNSDRFARLVQGCFDYSPSDSLSFGPGSPAAARSRCVDSAHRMQHFRRIACAVKDSA